MQHDKVEQDRKSRHNETFRCVRVTMFVVEKVRVTMFVVEKQKVSHILSVYLYSYTAHKAHEPYFIVICGPSGSFLVSHKM
jgi:hypothetical protein